MRYTETPAELVLYPGASHMFTSTGKPSIRKDVFERIVAWLERWCGKPAPASQPERDEALVD